MTKILHTAKESEPMTTINIILEQYAARLFGKGTRQSRLPIAPQKLGAASAQGIKASWQAAKAKRPRNG